MASGTQPTQRKERDFSVANARIELEALVDAGLDINVKDAVSLILKLRMSDSCEPSNVAASVMRDLKRKDGTSWNFSGMQVVQHQRWPPALKAVRMVTEAVLHKKLHLHGHKAVAINDVIANVASAR